MFLQHKGSIDCPLSFGGFGSSHSSKELWIATRTLVVVVAVVGKPYEGKKSLGREGMNPGVE